MCRFCSYACIVQMNLWIYQVVYTCIVEPDGKARHLLSSKCLFWSILPMIFRVKFTTISISLRLFINYRCIIFLFLRCLIFNIRTWVFYISRVPFVPFTRAIPSYIYGSAHENFIFPWQWSIIPLQLDHNVQCINFTESSEIGSSAFLEVLSPWFLTMLSHIR